MNFSEILVVCTGNICRSPVAQALLQAQCRDLSVRSAGLRALIDQKADPTSLALAKDVSGLDLKHHRARQIDTGMIDWADLILVMTKSQRRMITHLLPVASGKTMLFGRWLDDTGGKEIEDPFAKELSIYEQVHNQLMLAAELWCEKLS